MSTVLLGDINLTELAHISDPMYSKGVWCTANIKVVPGTYRTCIVENNGINVALVAINIDSETSKWCPALCDVGVDSGMMSITAYENYLDTPASSDELYGELCALGKKNAKKLKTVENSVVSVSGYGDGVYPVYLKMDATAKITGLAVVFVASDDYPEETMVKDGTKTMLQKVTKELYNSQIVHEDA